MSLCQGLVKLADFGVAAKLRDNGAPSLEDCYDTVAGSPYWMAPEVRWERLGARCCGKLGEHKINTMTRL